MNILIIEDEKHTAKDLSRTILEAAPDAYIVDIISSVEEGREYLRQHSNIDLIFSDIQLGDGLSFEIFESLKTEIPVIFCTAHDEYALKAFKTFSIDYILKPFSKEAVARALNKFSKLLPNKKKENSQDYGKMLEQLKQYFKTASGPSIILHQGERIIPIDGEKIALFFIDHENVYACTFEQKKILTHYKLDMLEKKFFPRFFRANRQFLINRKAVKEVSQHFHRKLQIHLTIPFLETILVGKEKVTSFLEWLSNT